MLSKPLWPLCSCAAVFTLAPLALNTSHIFLTLGSSRLTLGRVNSVLPVSRDQSARCLFGPAPCVCKLLGVCMYDCIYWSQNISVSFSRVSNNPLTPSAIPNWPHAAVKEVLRSFYLSKSNNTTMWKYFIMCQCPSFKDFSINAQDLYVKGRLTTFGVTEHYIIWSQLLIN